MKRVKILLVRLVTPKGLVLNVVPPLGLGYLATALCQAGLNEVLILDCVKEGLDFAQFEEKIKEIKPNFVGFQVFSHDLDSLAASLKIVRKNNWQIITLAGGPHPSGFPEGFLKDFRDLDFAFKGEGEIGLPLLVKKLTGQKISFAEIPGLIWRNRKKIVVNPQIFPLDLDSLGFPAWDLIRPDEYPDAPQGVFFKNLPIAPIMATRGCPYQCTFCAGRTVTGLKIRARSVNNVISEIKFLNREYGVKEIHLLDDNFTLSRQYVKDFCQKLLQTSLRISWCCPNGIRMDTLDLEILQLMKAAGCYYVSVGIESGSNRILRLMKKGLTVEKITKQIEMIKKSGLAVNGFFILGYPGETKKEIERTIKFSLCLGLTRVAYYNFLPLPGTPVYEKLIKSGEIKLQEMNFSQVFQSETPYAPKSMTKEELKKLQQKAYLRFYLRPQILWSLIREIKTLTQLKYIIRRATAYLNIKALPPGRWRR